MGTSSRSSETLYASCPISTLSFPILYFPIPVIPAPQLVLALPPSLSQPLPSVPSYRFLSYTPESKYLSHPPDPRFDKNKSFNSSHYDRNTYLQPPPTHPSLTSSHSPLAALTIPSKSSSPHSLSQESVNPPNTYPIPPSPSPSFPVGIGIIIPFAYSPRVCEEGGDGLRYNSPPSGELRAKRCKDGEKRGGGA